jgi:hypothetical protein
LSRNGQVLIKATVSRHDRLLTFVAEHDCLLHCATMVQLKETPQLWHRRLKHAHFDVLTRMQSEGLVTGVHVSAEEFRAAKNTVCAPCQQGKQTQGSHSPSHKRSTAPLDLIHIDLLEIPTVSQRGCRHVLVLVDDNSRLSAIAGLSN